MSKIDSMLIGAKIRMQKFGESVREFWQEEHGVSNIVATIVLVLLVVLLLGVFWDRLQTWLSEIMDTIFGSKYTTDKLPT